MVISVILIGRPALLADEKSIGSIAQGDILWAPSSPLTAQLEFTQVSESEGQITLTVTAVDFFEATDAHAEIVVPQGLAPTESTFTWEGNIDAGSEIRFSAPITVASDGTWKIKGSVLVGDPNGEFLGDVDYLYLEVKDNAIVSEWEQPYYDGSSKPLEPIADIPISSAVGAAVPINGNNFSPQPASIDDIQMRPSPNAQVQEVQSSGDAEQEAPSGDLTVTGCFFYLDYLDTILPLVWATVRIQDIDLAGPVDLGVDLTGLDGCFSFGPMENDDGPLEGLLDIRVQVLASSSVVTVLDPSGNVYDGFSPVYENTPDGTLNIGNLAVPASEQGAWTIFSYHAGLTKTWNYLKNEGPGFDVGPVVARYPFENWPHYHISGFYAQEIHMPDLDSAKSPDTIAHEYGHHVMWFTYGGFFPFSFCPSPHYVNRSSHVNCAWTEGFADFSP